MYVVPIGIWLHILHSNLDFGDITASCCCTLQHYFISTLQTITTKTFYRLARYSLVRAAAAVCKMRTYVVFTCELLSL